MKLKEYFKNFSIFQKWKYLGYSELAYYNKDPAKIHTRYIVHFYAKINGDKSICRKVKFSDNYPEYGVKNHSFYQKHIKAWLAGDNLYGPIQEPSDWLIRWTKEVNGYERINGQWVKPP